MLDRLLKIESQLARAEARLLVIFVLTMLALATYNVFYRNVLVPIQVDLLTKEPDVRPPSAVSDSKPKAEPKKGKTTDDESEGFGGGFGGDDEGFGGGFDDEGTEPVEAPADDSDGFGGDFEDDGDSDEPKPSPPDDSSGFGGDFEDTEPEPDTADGFGGDFGETDAAPPLVPTGSTAPMISSADPYAAPEENVPWFAAFVDAVKLEWIDVVLRQLVLVVGFLGAMLATRRRKHITVDALSKLVPEKALHWVAVVTNLVSIAVCVLLAKAGTDLVAISVEYPKEIVAWADEWQFQLVFPIGFGLLILHFVIRLVESLLFALGKEQPPEGYSDGGAA